MIVWMLLSCTVNRMDTGFWIIEHQDPTIEVFEIDCENKEWTIEVWTEHWTGNGLLWMANDNRYERHTLYSVSADASGEGDRLRVQLPVVADWRDAQSGRSSGFNCMELEQMGFFIGIRHPQTLDITDCAEYIEPDAFTGESTLALWEHVPLPDCFVSMESSSE